MSRSNFFRSNQDEEELASQIIRMGVPFKVSSIEITPEYNFNVSPDLNNRFKISQESFLTT